MTPNVGKDVGKEEQFLLLLEMQSDADTAKINAEVPPIIEIDQPII